MDLQESLTIILNNGKDEAQNGLYIEGLKNNVLIVS